MEGSTSCAPRFSSFSEEEKAALIEKVTPQSTKSATKFWVRVVCDFACEKGISFDFATIEEGQLARLLEDFYCSLRKKDGTEYKRSSYLNADFLSKNHQGGVAGSSSETKGAITKPEMVAAFERYISKLHPQLDRLFQRAKYGEGVLKVDSPVWFMNQPLGHNTLAKMMKNLSEAAKLSSVYTNHCVRVTSIVNMKEAGAEDRKICAISGHRNLQSLQAYDRPTHRDVQALSRAIDKENGPPRTPFTRTAAMSDEMSASRMATSSSSGFPQPSMVSAVGSQWHNVTINIAPQAEKRKARVSLKLNKKKKIQDADKPDSEHVS